MKVDNSYSSDFSAKLVKDIVLEIHGSAEIFEKYGIDFCCGGNKTLQSACEKKGINPEDVELELIQNTGIRSESVRFESWDLDFLAQYIVNNHHSYVKNAIPRITKLVQKVSTVHGNHYSFLNDVKNLFENLSAEMLSHMRKEEEILFRMIQRLAECKRENRKPEQLRKVISAPINMMEIEHDSAGNLTAKIRELTENYRLPGDACTTFALTYQELQEFERDLHKHVFLENNILFPRALELERELMD